MKHLPPPQPITALFGRERERDAIVALLLRDDLRLLTLAGPGGVGKTRLALLVAAALAPAFADGVAFVALDAIRDAHMVLPAIAQALGIRAVDEQPLLDHIQRYLQQRQLLLLLDNFEHVIEATPLLSTLLASCAGLKLLVTSRTLLRAAGEHSFGVLPLALPAHEPLEQPNNNAALANQPAVRLFVDRARAACPNFALTDTNTATVAAICQQLDGLPLALELAAARLKLLTPEALLARLTNRLGVLTQGTRDLPAQQQTLRATLDWSYALLSPDEQILFARLAVFAGSWALEAAEAICGEPGVRGQRSEVRGQLLVTHPPSPIPHLPSPILDLLDSLLDKSMLFKDPAPNHSNSGPRLRMLETIREYALQRLIASGELHALRERHAAYYLALAERASHELLGPDQLAWLNRLELAHDNLRVALQWAIGHSATDTALGIAGALWRFWHMHGYVSEGRAWLEEALAQGPGAGVQGSESKRPAPRMQQIYEVVQTPTPLRPPPLPSRARALRGAGWLTNAQGDAVAAERYFSQALALSEQLNDSRGIGMALSGLGRVAHLQGQHARAVTLYEQGLGLFRAIQDTKEIGWSLTRLGLLALEQGASVRALHLLEESQRCFDAANDSWGATWAQLYSGDIAFACGDAASAAARYQGALAHFRALGDHGSTAAALMQLARVALAQGDQARASACFEESLVLQRQLQGARGSSECLTHAARIAAEAGLYSWAVQLLAAAERNQRGTTLAADQLRETARLELGEPAFSAAWASGNALAPEQALLVPALERLAPPPLTPTDQHSELTARERDVLRLVTTGITDAQVAAQLHLSPRTVNAHLRSIYSKLGVNSRSAATRRALDDRLV